jgi:5'-nucleotidase
MIISGINYGLNIGTDVIYSGTVSAAIEGVIYKIPSMAVSMDINNNDDALVQAASYTRSILKTANENYIKNDMVINVNIPERIDKGISGVKVCQLGNRIYSNCYIETISDNNEVGFKLQGEVCDDSEENTDVHFIKNRYITITPLHYDLTNFKVLKDVEKWFISTDLK